MSLYIVDGLFGSMIYEYSSMYRKGKKDFYATHWPNRKKQELLSSE